MVFVVGLNSSRYPVIGKIVCILSENDNVLFVCALLVNLGLNSHVRGFEVVENDDLVQD